MSQTQEKAPGDESKGHVKLDNTIVSKAADIYPDHKGLVAGCYVAVVQVRGTDAAPKYRRRVLFNLPSAQRAVDRATAAGLDASVILCQLIPAGGDK
ncbi:hypothetical protein CVS30_03835 [Arthrobacter psychrolactophilus]|uniref:Uncharacterized protein n=1 Tax=Arthrobacter psychrolactophilus TaxID=92442 RepID=A0A2V5J9B1_9MICC|nr:hypothetical protein [Arthrobacter psychrolactophilus]PYI39800.1 hypothetical protein CVS30_03835 [Arthrobacter psychrolactophilus]